MRSIAANDHADHDTATTTLTKPLLLPTLLMSAHGCRLNPRSVVLGP